MNTILRKTLALITAAFFTLSLPSSTSLYAWPWSKSSNNSAQESDFSTTGNIDGSIGRGTGSARTSGQATGPNFNASGDGTVGANLRQGVAGGEVRGQAATDIAGVPVNVAGNASATGRGTVDSSGRPSIDFQTQTNTDASIGRRYSAQDSGSVSSGPYAQTSISRTSQDGNASFSASNRVGTVRAEGGYSATADSSGARLDVHGNARATLVEADVRAHYRTGIGSTTVDVTTGGRTSVGVEATGTGHASVDRRGISTGGGFDVMAGARQQADAGATLNILGLVKITTRVQGELYEGTGLKAHADVQASMRGLAIKTGLAAASGGGAGLTTEFEIDVSGITEPIGKAIDATIGAIGRGAKSLWDKIFGKKEEKEGEEAAAACAAQGDNVFCTGGAAGGPRPNPQPDPAEEARRREEQRRREREERKREEEEQKRREKEEKERKRREKEEREKEERKKKGEETWRKMPPLAKPKTGGATGRTLDPDTGEITEGVMDPDGTTTITKRDAEGNLISEETHNKFAAFDALRTGIPAATLDGNPNSRDMNSGELTVDKPAEADGYKSGPEC
ncbi:MAG: hypothetical protein HY584_00010 [Candidatus Omnitrophica bacterium]|nr:hypothetical protein [Candidatus Omnitrophota bacterium]